MNAYQTHKIKLKKKMKKKSTYSRKKQILRKHFSHFRRQNHVSEQKININIQIIKIKIILER